MTIAHRSTLVVHGRLAMRESRLAAGRAGRHGLQIISFEQTAVRLAGGLRGGLTVRQPLARKLGEQALAQARGQASSPWDIIARDADQAFSDDKTGLSPWWAMEGAELKRHLFALPQSRDIDRFAKLRTQRLLYRLALGQPDQEDLVDLMTHHDVETTRSLQALTLDLSAFSRQENLDE